MSEPADLRAARDAYRTAVRAHHELPQMDQRLASWERSERSLTDTVDRLERIQGSSLAPAQRRLDELRHRIDDGRCRRSEAAAAAASLGLRLEALRAAFAQHDPESLDHLAHLESECAAAERLSTDLRRLSSALGRVRECVAAAIEEFGRAENLGEWDVIGAGFIVSVAKHQRVDSGLTALDRLAQELIDLGDMRDGFEHPLDVTVPDRLRPGSTSWTWDVWFDNVVADIAMQDRITDMGNRLAVLRHRVEQVVPAIDERRSSADAEFARLRTALTKLLLG